MRSIGVNQVFFNKNFRSTLKNFHQDDNLSERKTRFKALAVNSICSKKQAMEEYSGEWDGGLQWSCGFRDLFFSRYEKSKPRAVQGGKNIDRPWR